METFSICLLAGYVFLLLYRATTWRYNQDVVKIASIMGLNAKSLGNLFYSKTYLVVVKICTLRFILLLGIVWFEKSLWIALGCLVADFAFKIIYYAINVEKQPAQNSIQEILYTLEKRSFENCKNLKTFLSPENMFFEQLLDAFKKAFINCEEYEIIWVEDLNGEHIIQVIKNYTIREYVNKKIPHVLVGKSNVMIDGVAYLMATADIQALKEKKEKNGVVEIMDLGLLEKQVL